MNLRWKGPYNWVQKVREPQVKPFDSSWMMQQMEYWCKERHWDESWKKVRGSEKRQRSSVGRQGHGVTGFPAGGREEGQCEEGPRACALSSYPLPSTTTTSLLPPSSASLPFQTGFLGHRLFPGGQGDPGHQLPGRHREERRPVRRGKGGPAV